MSSGWICLHRSLQDHWLFNIDESDKFFAWVDLLMMANHKPEKFMIKNKLIECNRGQVAKSQITLQKRWKWSQNKLKRFLNLLKNERMIDYETNEQTTIITICNYSKFQDIVNQDGRPHERTDGRPHERTTDEQTDDKQQYNNENNVNKKTSNRANRPNSLFKKPSIEELKDYIQEKKYMVNADKFFAFYESNGWKVGRNPMKCWKSALTSWNASSYSDTAKPIEKKLKMIN